MSDPLFWHRLQFGFTITCHDLLPQLAMGLLLAVGYVAVVFRLHRGRVAGGGEGGY